MAIALVNDRHQASVSTEPRSAPMVGARLRLSAPDAVALPPGVTAHGPVRWIVPSDVGSVRLLLRAVLSAAWRSVAV